MADCCRSVSQWVFVWVRLLTWPPRSKEEDEEEEEPLCSGCLLLMPAAAAAAAVAVAVAKGGWWCGAAAASAVLSRQRTDVEAMVWGRRAGRAGERYSDHTFA